MTKKRILFMGDSITNAGCDDTCDYHLGYGYATLVASSLGHKRPNEFEFINRGVCGDRIIDLLARIKRDAINLQPDYMSVLVGVNDVGRELGEDRDGIDAELFEIYYDSYLFQLKKALPDLQIMIMEPFLSHGCLTEEKWEVYRGEVEKRGVVAKKMAEKYGCCFVPLRTLFDEACAIAPAGQWSRDGVHPADAGHEIIKRAWLEAFPG